MARWVTSLSAFFGQRRISAANTPANANCAALVGEERSRSYPEFGQRFEISFVSPRDRVLFPASHAQPVFAGGIGLDLLDKGNIDQD